MSKVIYGSVINPVTPDSLEYFQNGAVIVNDRGVIEFCGAADDLAPDSLMDVIDHSGNLILPGFIDCHCHISQVRAVNVRYSELLAWLQHVVFPLEAGYDRATAKAEGHRFFRHLFSCGITTAGIYVTVSEQATDEVFNQAENEGMRAIIGKVMMDRHAPESLLENTARSLEASARLCEKWNHSASGRLHYAFTPRFALTCSFELMRQSGKLAAEMNAHIMTHVAENKNEIQRARELFPDYDSYLKIYQAAGMLGPKTILAHAIHMTNEDWDIVKQTGAGIAHCPSANLLLESGILDLSLPLSRGIGVGLGTDIGAGAEPAIMESAEAAIISQIARKVLGHSYYDISPETALYFLTRGGAKAMGLENEIGSLTPGKKADMVVIDPRPSLPMQEWPDDLPPTSLLYALLFRFRQRSVRHVYVDGKEVFSKS